jgi:hypothetical protein
MHHDPMLARAVLREHAISRGNLKITLSRQPSGMIMTSEQRQI